MTRSTTLPRMPGLDDRRNESLDDGERFDGAWKKVKLKCETKIHQSTKELISTNCTEQRSVALRWMIAAYEDVLSLEKKNEH